MSKLKDAFMELWQKNPLDVGELSKHIGITRACFYDFLRGRTQITRLYTMQELFAAMGYTIGALLPEEDHIDLDLRGAIQRERWNQDLTKYGLAKRAGLSVDVVDKVENKLEMGINVNTLEALADALEIRLLLVPLKGVRKSA